MAGLKNAILKSRIFKAKSSLCSYNIKTIFISQYWPPVCWKKYQWFLFGWPKNTALPGTFLQSSSDSCLVVEKALCGRCLWLQPPFGGILLCLSLHQYLITIDMNASKERERQKYSGQQYEKQYNIFVCGWLTAFLSTKVFYFLLQNF